VIGCVPDRCGLFVQGKVPDCDAVVCPLGMIKHKCSFSILQNDQGFLLCPVRLCHIPDDCNHKICSFQVLSEYCLKNNWGEPNFSIMTVKSLQDDEVYMCRVSCKEIVGGDGGVWMCGVRCEETVGSEYGVYMCRVSCKEIVGGECGVWMCGVRCE
jgi:hypothetical protein